MTVMTVFNTCVLANVSAWEKLIDSNTGKTISWSDQYDAELTRKHRQSYRHADPRRQRLQVAQHTVAGYRL